MLSFPTLLQRTWRKFWPSPGPLWPGQCSDELLSSEQLYLFPSSPAFIYLQWGARVCRSFGLNSPSFVLLWFGRKGESIKPAFILSYLVSTRVSRKVNGTKENKIFLNSNFRTRKLAFNKINTNAKHRLLLLHI